MRKGIISLSALFWYGNVSAFSLSDIASTASEAISSSTSSSSSSTSVSSIVSTVASVLIGDTAVSASTIAGTWTYQTPAVKLESDNALTEAAGELVTSQAETKLNTAFTSVGITAGSLVFTFDTDMSFSCSLSGKTLSGTYVIDGDEKLTLTFSALGQINIGSVSTDAIISSGNLSLLFSADKLLSIISALASVSDNSTIQTINTLASSYDGVKLGFKFSK